MGIIRNTRQKNIINEEVNSMGSFFTSEDLFKKVRKKDPKMGIATVYRLLKELRDKRIIHAYSCDRKMIYTINKRSHCHFICEKCGRSSHVDMKDIGFINNKLNGKTCHFQLDIHGICNDCLDEKER
jgi:Fe2+ or Zn2+ uptake regulation protein